MNGSVPIPLLGGNAGAFLMSPSRESQTVLRANREGRMVRQPDQRSAFTAH